VTEPASLWGTLASLLAVGFFGSVHCFGMCGGIAGALTQAIPAERRSRLRVALTHVCFSVGRVGSYALAGAIAGSVGLVLGRLLGPSAPVVFRCAAGLIMIAIGLYVSGWWLGLRRLEEPGARLWGRLAPALGRLRPAESLPRAVGLGVLWGWLPCGLVYGALASAMSRGDAATGALAMLAFGIGTMPALVATGTLARELPRLVRSVQTRRTAGITILLFGLWTIGTALLALQRSHTHVH
jgi:sulfite exporter TauE/SafE